MLLSEIPLRIVWKSVISKTICSRGRFFHKKFSVISSIADEMLGIFFFVDSFILSLKHTWFISSVTLWQSNQRARDDSARITKNISNDDDNVHNGDNNQFVWSGLSANNCKQPKNDRLQIYTTNDIVCAVVLVKKNSMLNICTAKSDKKQIFQRTQRNPSE